MAMNSMYMGLRFHTYIITWLIFCVFRDGEILSGTTSKMAIFGDVRGTDAAGPRKVSGMAAGLDKGST